MVCHYRYLLAAVLFVSVGEMYERVDRHKHCCPPGVAGVGTYCRGTDKRGDYGGGSGSAEYETVGQEFSPFSTSNASMSNAPAVSISRPC